MTSVKVCGFEGTIDTLFLQHCTNDCLMFLFPLFFFLASFPGNGLEELAIDLKLASCEENKYAFGKIKVSKPQNAACWLYLGLEFNSHWLWLKKKTWVKEKLSLLFKSVPYLAL